MDKDISYYQHVAEDFYLSHFAEIKEERDKKKALLGKRQEEFDSDTSNDHDDLGKYFIMVNVNTNDDSCFFPNNHSDAVRPQELLFMCQMNSGNKVKSTFLKSGKDKVAEILGLADKLYKTERVEIEYVRKEDQLLHLDLPEQLQKYDRDFFKVKLYGLEDFVNECNYTGWGDELTCNVLEILAGIMKQDCLKSDTQEIKHCLNWYVGPGEDDDASYYAEFNFSHCEIAKDDNDFVWTIFVCYNYLGLTQHDD